MFTGLIEELGTIESLSEHVGGVRIVVGAELVTSDIANGDSIAVNGVCLTALDPKPNSFAADMSPETLDRTTLGRLATGSRVNLERAVTPATRLGQTLVTFEAVAGQVFLVTVVALTVSNLGRPTMRSRSTPPQVGPSASVDDQQDRQQDRYEDDRRDDAGHGPRP